MGVAWVRTPHGHQPRSSHEPKSQTWSSRSQCFTVGTTAKKCDELSMYAGMDATASIRSPSFPS
jgi:hypothetical protein